MHALLISLALYEPALECFKGGAEYYDYIFVLVLTSYIITKLQQPLNRPQHELVYLVHDPLPNGCQQWVKVAWCVFRAVVSLVNDPLPN